MEILIAMNLKSTWHKRQQLKSEHHLPNADILADSKDCYSSQNSGMLHEMSL